MGSRYSHFFNGHGSGKKKVSNLDMTTRLGRGLFPSRPKVTRLPNELLINQAPTAPLSVVTKLLKSELRKQKKKEYGPRRQLTTEELTCNETGCGRVFSTRSQKTAHMKSHSVRKEHICVQCGKCFKNKITLQTHELVIHEGKQIPCKYCTMEFNSLNHRSIHVREFHLDLPEVRDRLVYKRITCKYCKDDKEYNTKEQLRLHSMEFHKDEEDNTDIFKCKTCGKLHNTKQAMEDHYDRMHTEERKWLCNDCGKSYKTKIDLVIHSRIHMTVRPFTCHICGKGYTMNALLQQHIARIHDGKTFDCHICSKKYFSTQGLEHHVKTLHENPNHSSKPGRKPRQSQKTTTKSSNSNDNSVVTNPGSSSSTPQQSQAQQNVQPGVPIAFLPTWPQQQQQNQQISNLTYWRT